MVFGKLDWYSAMVYNVSFKQVLEFLNVEYDFYNDLIANGFQRNCCYSTQQIFTFNGITLEINFDDYILLDLDFDDIFTHKFSHIRIDISGIGLDFLRGIFKRPYELELYLHNVQNYISFGELGKDVKITRADFAFDFVNYEKCPDFVEQLLDWFFKTEYNPEFRTSSGGLYTGRSTPGLKYSLRTGDQHTIYFGTTRSNKLLRIYNKLMQYQKNGVLIKPLPFSDDLEVKSWFRIEFQTRKVEAEKYLFGFTRFEDILKIIFNDYLIRDKNGNPVPILLDLYDWGSLQEITYNVSFMQLKTVIETAKTNISRSMQSIVLYIARYGVRYFLNYLYNEMKKLSYESKSASSRSLAFNIKTSRMLNEENLCFDDLYLSNFFGSLNLDLERLGFKDESKN